MEEAILGYYRDWSNVSESDVLAKSACDQTCRQAKLTPSTVAELIRNFSGLTRPESRIFTFEAIQSIIRKGGHLLDRALVQEIHNFLFQAINPETVQALGPIDVLKACASAQAAIGALLYPGEWDCIGAIQPYPAEYQVFFFASLCKFFAFPSSGTLAQTKQARARLGDEGAGAIFQTLLSGATHEAAAMRVVAACGIGYLARFAGVGLLESPAFQEVFPGWAQDQDMAEGLLLVVDAKVAAGDLSAWEQVSGLLTQFLSIQKAGVWNAVARVILDVLGAAFVGNIGIIPALVDVSVNMLVSCPFPKVMKKIKAALNMEIKYLTDASEDRNRIFMECVRRIGAIIGAPGSVMYGDVEKMRVASEMASVAKAVLASVPEPDELMFGACINGQDFGRDAPLCMAVLVITKLLLADKPEERLISLAAEREILQALWPLVEGLGTQDVINKLTLGTFYSCYYLLSVVISILTDLKGREEVIPADQWKTLATVCRDTLFSAFAVILYSPRNIVPIALELLHLLNKFSPMVEQPPDASLDKEGMLRLIDSGESEFLEICSFVGFVAKERMNASPDTSVQEIFQLLLQRVMDSRLSGEAVLTARLANLLGFVDGCSEHGRQFIPQVWDLIETSVALFQRHDELMELAVKVISRSDSDALTRRLSTLAANVRGIRGLSAVLDCVAKLVKVNASIGVSWKVDMFNSLLPAIQDSAILWAYSFPVGRDNEDVIEQLANNLGQFLRSFGAEGIRRIVGSLSAILHCFYKRPDLNASLLDIADCVREEPFTFREIDFWNLLLVVIMSPSFDPMGSEAHKLMRRIIELGHDLARSLGPDFYGSFTGALKTYGGEAVDAICAQIDFDVLFSPPEGEQILSMQLLELALVRMVAARNMFALQMAQ